jgi:hypothetical protein
MTCPEEWGFSISHLILRKRRNGVLKKSGMPIETVLNQPSQKGEYGKIENRCHHESASARQSDAWLHQLRYPRLPPPQPFVEGG